MFKVRRIVGMSMAPGLTHGRVVVFRAMLRLRYKPGDIVLLRHDGIEKIKRIRELRDRNGHIEVYVRGDNAGVSTDSRAFGWIPLDVINGKLLWPRKNH